MGIAASLFTQLAPPLVGHDFPLAPVGLAVALGLAEEDALELIAAGAIGVDENGCVSAETLVEWLEANGAEWFRARQLWVLEAARSFAGETCTMAVAS